MEREEFHSRVKEIVFQWNLTFLVLTYPAARIIWPPTSLMLFKKIATKENTILFLFMH